MIPDRSTGHPSPRHRLSGSPGAAAYAAAVLGFTYAAVSLYWAAGGTALLSTVGGSVEHVGRQGGLPAVALGLAAAGLKLAVGILALALARPWGRAIPRTWLLACATGASAVLACYGAIQVTAGSLVLSGAVRPAATVDWTALRWHVLVWDMWFLIWGILLAAATVAAWRQSRNQEPAFEPGHTERACPPDAGSRAGDPAAQVSGTSPPRTCPAASASRPGGRHHSASSRSAAQSTLHRLTGGAIGKTLGMLIGTAAGLGQPPNCDLGDRSRLRVRVRAHPGVRGPVAGNRRYRPRPFQSPRQGFPSGRHRSCARTAHAPA